MKITPWMLKGGMSVPVVGWVFYVYGLFRPFSNRYLKTFWWITIGLVGLLHALQIPIAMPVGKKAGLSSSRIVAKTMLYGASWWKPLESGLISR